MSSFHLQIVTPDGLFYDGQAESLNLRAAQGGLTILPRHTNFVTTVGMGPAKVVLEGKSRIAACIGGAGFMEYYVQRLHRRYAERDKRRGPPDCHDVRVGGGH